MGKIKAQDMPSYVIICSICSLSSAWPWLLNHFTISNIRVMIRQKSAFRFKKSLTTRLIWWAQHSSVINHWYLEPRSHIIFFSLGPSSVHQAITTTPNLSCMYWIQETPHFASAVRGLRLRSRLISETKGIKKIIYIMTKIDKVFVAVQYAKWHYNGIIMLELFV